MNEETSLFNINEKAMASPKLTAILFVEVLYQFFRQTELHEPTNSIFDRCVQNVARVLANLKDFPDFYPIEIFFRGEQIYVNELRLRPKPRQFRIYRYLIRFLRYRKVGSIKFHKILNAEELRTCLWAVANISSTNDSAFDEAAQFIAAQGIDGFEMGALKKSMSSSLTDEQNAAMADVELVAVLLHEKLRRFADICFANLDKAKEFSLDSPDEFLDDLCGLPEEDILYVFRLNLAKKHERYLSYLAADTCFALVAWGRSLGLPPGVLKELAGTGLAHPLLFVHRDQVNMEPMSESESMQIHKLLIRLEGVWPLTELQKLSLMEWTFPYGPEGVYNWDSTKCYAHFFSRMLRIVAVFKQLTHFLPGQSPLLPDEAMTRMLGMKESFDPTLLKLFVNWMGVYPVGTLVQLQSGEVAQVFAAGSDPLRFQRPIVSVLKDADGKLLERPRLVDLTEMNEKLGIYRKSIRKSLSPGDVDIPPDLFQMAPIGF